MFKASTAWFNLRLVERLLSLMGKNRLRLELYVEGRVEENLTRLSDHGILHPDIPVVLGGSLEFDYHGWLSQQVLSLIENQRQLSQHPSLQTLLSLLIKEATPVEEHETSIVEG